MSKAQNTKTSPQTVKADIYTRVTDTIVKSLEEGARPWAKRWNVEGGGGLFALPLRANGTPYRGVNVLLLWAATFERGFNACQWMTYRQAQELGAQVRKGETGSLVVYADRFTKTETNDKGEDIEREIPFMKGYTVFNVEQIDGLPEQYRPKAIPLPSPVELHQASEEFFARTGATVRHGGHRAFFVPSLDVIQLPTPESFQDAESYAATKAHEFIHWSGHKSRLARDLSGRFGDQAYAFEELIAELGAAFLCATLRISPEVRDDHAGYLQSWLKALKNDKRAIFTAATHAQAAADYLHGLQEVQQMAA